MFGEGYHLTLVKAASMDDTQSVGKSLGRTCLGRVIT